MLGHKTSLNILKIRIIQSTYSTWNETGNQQEVTQNSQVCGNQILLNNQGAKEEITRKMIKYLEANRNENTTSRKLWDEIKVGLTGKFTAISTYIKKKTLNSTT